MMLNTQCYHTKSYLNPLAAMALLFWVLLVPGFSQGAPLVDPTRPLGMVEFVGAGNSIQAQRMVLNSIFIRPNKRFVIIDGKHFSLDDRVGEYVISSIRSDRVMLTGEAGYLELRLRSNGLNQYESAGQREAKSSVARNQTYRDSVDD